jgi:SAM-dependent methyltransferase
MMKNNYTSNFIKRIAKHSIPEPAWLWARFRYKYWAKPDHVPLVGAVDFGDFRRLTPISKKFGADRGTIIDRYYTERFLTEHQGDVNGRVLEIGDNYYTIRYGSDSVTKSDVLHVEAGNPLATIVADLTCADDIPSNTFDCIIFTHTIQMIYDLQAAMRHLYRILKPGGVILMTTHGTSRVGRRSEKDNWCVYWRMTVDSARRLLSEDFGAENIHAQGHGNVLVAMSFLYGLAAEELTHEELDTYDPDYQVLITARAIKPNNRNV